MGALWGSIIGSLLFELMGDEKKAKGNLDVNTSPLASCARGAYNLTKHAMCKALTGQWHRRRARDNGFNPFTANDY
jgi:hypothetical protein